MKQAFKGETMEDQATMDKRPAVGEKRKYPRIEKNVSVKTNKLTYPINDDEFCSGRLKNLSRGGVLITIPERYKPETLLQIKLTLPGWRKTHPGFIRVYEDSIGSPLTVICEVVRAKKIGSEYETAVKFVNIDRDDNIALKGYLEKLLSSN
jgi:hypothetical protein